MTYSIADIKAVMKKKIFAYGNCNLSKNNPYYINDGAIKNAEAWFNDFAAIKELPAKQIESIQKHIKTLKSTYLYA